MADVETRADRFKSNQEGMIRVFYLSKYNKDMCGPDRIKFNFSKKNLQDIYCFYEAYQ